MSNLANIKIDVNNHIGELSHNWNYIGMDECNFIHTPEGPSGACSRFNRYKV